ncbi:hypothetical protein K7X08_028631 [Anisodus acutangulus]|uniref:Uncharacterized protein n=1 Tax=Anisodus acutangulus TaxID=402998 RepID=A0A9Q1LT84_9SOLA|nr:hypothetical protein K7X08_028631 [Anisodus acutangulus]
MKSYQKKSRNWRGKCTGDLLNGKRGEFSPDEPVVERQHVSITESLPKQKPVVSSATTWPPEDSNLVFSVGSSRCRLVPRKCTNLSHLLTLRSQGTKWGCSTVCGECAQEISWEGWQKSKVMLSMVDGNALLGLGSL